MKIEAKNLADLPQIANALVEFARDNNIYIFEGDMGAGKTTFIKYFCAALGVTDVVSSPTYSIVNEYTGANKTVYHFDFYRIKNIHEAYDLGYEEYFYSNSICLIEWPSKIAELLPDNYVSVKIVAIDEEHRLFEFNKL
jgi:tRNA threonylcarbamoyladenosine biosynthesis protein TsaE